MPEGELKDAPATHLEHMKAAVRSKVEHPFHLWMVRQIDRLP